MIENLRVVNFKSHRDTEIELSDLTVLCGQNGVGKSSLIQSLLLLRQSHMKNRLDKVLDLNDPLCFVGRTKDALYQYADDLLGNEISFVLSDSAKMEYSWMFDTSKESSFLNRINDIADSEGYESLALFQNNFQYISAARGQEYLNDDYAVLVQQQISKYEGKGELTAQFLENFGKSLKVHPALFHQSQSDEFLGEQTSAWEREISKGVNVKPTRVGDSYEMRYSFSNTKYGETDDFSSRNVGFGLSYSLPVIVAILSAEPGSLLLIENPEAHLHPYGQAKIIELICKAAQAGIQIIVETHSDHVINGIFIQIRAASHGKGIASSKVRIYYFDRDEREQNTSCTQVKISSAGRMQNRPLGFGDQLGNDLRKLF